MEEAHGAYHETGVENVEKRRIFSFFLEANPDSSILHII
jgi:hypothetical protein